MNRKLSNRILPTLIILQMPITFLWPLEAEMCQSKVISLFFKLIKFLPLYLTHYAFKSFFQQLRHENHDRPHHSLPYFFAWCFLSDTKLTTTIFKTWIWTWKDIVGIFYKVRVYVLKFWNLDNSFIPFWVINFQWTPATNFEFEFRPVG